MSKPMLATLLGQVPKRPPVWIMRQAGRYLPEYRETRKKAKNFLDLCFSPDLASEVTLQPLRRFDLDAAIVFSDILVVPFALGQKVSFVEGEGPVLEAVDAAGIERLGNEEAAVRLQPVLETLRLVKGSIDASKTLIGFCGSPWTVATYMIGGRGSVDQAAAKVFALREPLAFGKLIDMLVAASVDYLVAQLQAGADVVQLFESWALNLDEDLFYTAVIEPNRRIVEGVRTLVPNAPIIGFPRGAAGMLPGFVKQTGVNGVGLDTAVPLAWARENIPASVAVQGNLDPLRLVVGGEQMFERADQICAAFEGRPHIFNLGHGIVPQTPIAHVDALIKHVKGQG